MGCSNSKDIENPIPTYSDIKDRVMELKHVTLPRSIPFYSDFAYNSKRNTLDNDSNKEPKKGGGDGVPPISPPKPPRKPMRPSRVSMSNEPVELNMSKKPSPAVIPPSRITKNLSLEEVDIEIDDDYDDDNDNNNNNNNNNNDDKDKNNNNNDNYDKNDTNNDEEFKTEVTASAIEEISNEENAVEEITEEIIEEENVIEEIIEEENAVEREDIVEEKEVTAIIADDNVKELTTVSTIDGSEETHTNEGDDNLATDENSPKPPNTGDKKVEKGPTALKRKKKTEKRRDQVV